uniref:YciI family protein n=1 Tax=Marinobacterium profundum TaxID=1714300 RepID=UPI00082AE59A|nr:YciI family protein [Marinobacterium profundum]
MSNGNIESHKIVELCESKGFLAKQLFVVKTYSAGNLDEVLANVEEHLKFQVELERKGIMFAAGPLFTEDGKEWDGEGLVIIRAESLEGADQIMASDPMHSSGARRYQIRPWLLNEGCMTVRISYSDGKREII